jgi:predicted nucleic acid-binding protein
VIVTDASVLIEMLLRTPTGDAAAEELLAEGRTLHAPHLVDLEVAHVFRRLEARREITARRALTAVETFADLRLTRYPHEPLLPRIWELRRNLTAYDAAYVALAEALRAPLFTCDGSLAGVPGMRAEVQILTAP